MNSSTKIVLTIIVALVLLGLAAAVLKSKPQADLSTGEINITDNASTTMTANNSGLVKNIIQAGSGTEAKSGDTVVVHYRGTLENGTQFDASYDRGTPFSFTLGEGRVIPGWEQGVLGMKVGEKRQLVVPGELAYGPSGVPGTPIGPNATLVFEVELLEIK